MACDMGENKTNIKINWKQIAFAVIIVICISGFISSIIYGCEILFHLLFPDLMVSDFFSLWKGCGIGILMGIIIAEARRGKDV